MTVEFLLHNVGNVSTGKNSVVFVVLLDRRFCGEWFLGVAILLIVAAAPAQGVAAAENGLTFENDVAPILKAHCFKCHGSGKQESGLDLRRRFTIVSGGDSGPAIVAGKPQKSLLIEMIEDRQMPPKGEPRLNDDQLAVIRRWISTGAAIAAKQEPPLAVADNADEVIDENARRHWAFQAVRKIAPPKVAGAAWLKNPVDAFTLAALEQRHWQPSPPAGRAEWMRRVYFDLVGLPPTPEEIAAFAGDSSPDAYERVVDRLLASPHYGERWAQHWLDVVRFAETEGFEYDRHVPDAWRFRDYVVDSLNADKPFDRFVTEQIAGDEIAPDDPQCQAAAIFHRLGAVRRNAGNPDIALSRNEVLTERTNIIGEAFLGLTIGCARCHNHKLEPITQKDYYRLEAYFAATEEHNITLAPPEEKQAWDRQTAAVNDRIKKLKEQASSASGDEKARLESQIDELEYELPPHLPTIPTICNDFEHRTEIHVLRRGVWEHKGIAVGPRPLSVLVSTSTPELAADISQPRTQLARWIADEEHPLTARVIVNRLWQHHFGAGLVKTPNDFGTRGAPPSHPKLLDWLARTLVENGWRLKPMHRLIVLSNTYRQSSDIRTPRTEDPENRLLWRFNRRRLSAEEIRDAMLAVAGRLNLAAGGPSVMVPVDPELVGLLYKPSQWNVTEDITEHDRRSIYLIAKRNLRLPFMEAFDAPGLQTSCPVRETSTHAPQALELLNGRFANEMAAAFASRLARECDGDPYRIVERAFRLAAGRGPTETERELSLDFLRDQPLPEFALAVFNLNGFIYVR